MQKNTKISIIVPVFNVEKYLGKCLESLINQTLKEIEIICINDGSTDNSLDILNTYAQKDDRIIIINKENEGVSAARNIGLKEAAGQYLMFVDSDDYLEKEACEKIFNKICKDNSDLLIFDYFNVKNDTKKVSNHLKNLSNIDTFYFNNANKFFFYIMTGILGKLYKNNIKFNPFLSQIAKGEDTVFFWQYCLENNPKISVLNEPLYNYLERDESAMFNPKHLLSCETFNAISYLINLKSYKSASKKTQIKILDRFAKSICYEYYLATIVLNINLPIKYLISTYRFLRLIKTFDKSMIKGLLFYKKLKKETLQYFTSKIFNIYNYEQFKYINIFGLKIKTNRYNFKRPIDIVYCWVDGNDTNWQNEKILWQEKLGIPVTDAINPCRFVDNEELKYSLRSVAKNLPWINHIYIITNGQIPKWLDENNSKVTIINHKDIMPPDALPTFNSEAIETCIANIPNLSEHFLYANDDFFVFKHISPDYFFDKKGNPIVRLSKQNWSKSEIQQYLYFTNIAYTEKLIFDKYKRKFRYETTHNIDALKKSYIIDCKKEFEKEFDINCRNKFRTANSIQRIVYNLYMVIAKNCKMKIVRIGSVKTPLENLYIPLSNPVLIDRKIQKHKKKLKLFCINDDENTLPQDREKLKDYLEFLFPDKQEWENNIS